MVVQIIRLSAPDRFGLVAAEGEQSSDMAVAAAKKELMYSDPFGLPLIPGSDGNEWIDTPFGRLERPEGKM